MNRILLPLFILFVFISESTFTDLIELPFTSEDQVIIPRFVMLSIVFITAYYSQKMGIIYGMVFGLLHDIVYTEILGIYLFAYPLFAYLISKALKALQGNMLVVLFLSLLAVTLLEFYSYGIQMLIGYSNLPFYDFTNLRLLPTILANSVGAIVLIYPMSRFISKVKRDYMDDL
ncbi:MULTISPECIES: rod shape-determining protein MreD [Metabacillus]|uniref:rod shape-determining protein MreD n=1 Tax=Metabacillus TaxID=2675233 RepID=UPI0004933898|nr:MULTISPECIES: rod shape-determining protein MreD [Metabacillus]KEZ51168.1 rod shape-determining protein MreD [Metabacillus indicus LMG 22858]MDX8289996.1 rod shape-determining protein MreD [Metabacillus indicus]